jgi:hypothetical protein
MLWWPVECRRMSHIDARTKRLTAGDQFSLKVGI